MFTSDISIRRLGIVTAVWGIVFAGFHFCWAAGGGAAYEGTPSLGESLYIAFIAVVGSADSSSCSASQWASAAGSRQARSATTVRTA